MNNSISLELLAPARNVEVGLAAIEAGADAVFIGGPQFGARCEASNSVEDLKRLCDAAHFFGAKVHVTVNTLLRDDEIDRAMQIIDSLCRIGADAIIAQDPVIFGSTLPKGVELHASTQCYINSPEKLKFFSDLGVSQVVLPREFSLEQIRIFHDSCPDIRLEAFVSGALCVSESGNCFISELLKNRSANRGECAQICRLPMVLKYRGTTVKQGFLLSMKDNFCGDLIPQMVSAGVSSFKIEGRLKDRSYVINQVAVLSDMLNRFIAASDGKYRRSSSGKVTRSFSPDIKKTFNRGFTSSMLCGDNNDLVNDRTPKFTGPKVARVTSVKSRGSETILELSPVQGIKLHNADGFTYFNDNELEGFACNSADNRALSIRGKIRIQKGTWLYRNHDVEFEKQLSSKNAVRRELDCSVRLDVAENVFSLTVADELGREGKCSFSYEYSPQAKALNQSKIEATLKKRGSEHCSEGRVLLCGDLSRLTIPVSFLNECRKKAYSSLFASIDRIRPDYQYIPPKTLPKWPCRAVDSRLVLNKKTASFYADCGVDLSLTDSLLENSVMTCRHCLVKNYAKCSKDGGTTSGFSLEIGRDSFKVFCDCKRCRMHLLRNKND